MSGFNRLETEEKYAELTERMKAYAEKGSVIVAFSGGVDSALLLKLACNAVLNAGSSYSVYAVTVRTKLHPAGDLETAAQAASEMGADHRVIELDELEEAGIGMNPVNRCYLCKKSIFLKIKELAAELDTDTILEGTNEDDLHQYRPGIQALRELGIRSPLAECGLKKSEIRELSKQWRISVADRPSSPCLATRLPYNTAISYELLRQIDEGETYLHELGFYDVRLRVHELGERKWLARIEILPGEMSKLISCKESITEKMKQLGFSSITLDLEGFRSGSMDTILGITDS